jgi:FtsH-binding integral membrane protein
MALSEMDFSNVLGTMPDSKLSETAQIGFVRKVLGIFSAQIAFTVLLNFFFLSSAGKLQMAHSLLPLSIVGLLISVIMITCCDKYARTVPINYILLGIATFCESILLSVTINQYPRHTVILAGAVTICNSLKKYQFLFFNFLN